MYPVFDEFQKRKQYGPDCRRLSLSRPVLEGSEEGQEGHATKNEEEEDLRIMQHFVRDLIGRSEDMDPL